MPTYTHEQSRRRQSVWYAADAASSRNPGKTVVALAVVLGSETAEVLVTSSSVTLGTRAFRCVKHGRSPRELAADSQTRLKE